MAAWKKLGSKGCLQQFPCSLFTCPSFPGYVIPRSPDSLHRDDEESCTAPTTRARLLSVGGRIGMTLLFCSRYQFVNEPSGRWKMGTGRNCSVISASSSKGF